MVDWSSVNTSATKFKPCASAQTDFLGTLGCRGFHVSGPVIERGFVEVVHNKTRHRNPAWRRNQFPGHFGAQRDPWTSSCAQAGFVESVQKCGTKIPHGNANQFPRHCGVHRDPWARSRDQAGFVEVAHRSGGTITPAWWHKPISCAPQVAAVWAAPRDQAGFVKNDSVRWRENPACRLRDPSTYSHYMSGGMHQLRNAARVLLHDRWSGMHS